MKAPHTICFILLSGLPLCPQAGLNNPPARQEVAKHPLVLEPPQEPQPRKVDLAKLHQESLDLAQLAQSIPSDIDHVAQGKLAKDLPDKLKQIEKLSKRLRSELQQ